MKKNSTESNEINIRVVWCSNQLTWHGIPWPGSVHAHTVYAYGTHFHPISWSAICQSKSFTPSLWLNCVLAYSITLFVLMWVCVCVFVCFFAKLHCFVSSKQLNVVTEHPAISIFICMLANVRAHLRFTRHNNNNKTIATKNN